MASPDTAPPAAEGTKGPQAEPPKRRQPGVGFETPTMRKDGVADGLGGLGNRGIAPGLESPRAVSPLLQSGLQVVVERLDRKLCNRLDLLELRLERLGDRIVAEVLAGGAAPSGAVADGRHEDPGGTPVADATLVSITEDADGGARATQLAVTPTDTEQGMEDDLPELAVHFARNVSPESAESPGARRCCLRDEWSDDTTPGREGKRRPTEGLRAKTIEELDQQMWTTERQRQSAHWWIIWPSTHFRLFWDILTMVIVAYDMAVIPVNLAFDNERDIMTDIAFWPTLIFWTVDIVVSFFTGYYKDGVVEVRLHRIAIEYLRTWFFLDFAMVGLTYSEVALGWDTDGLGLGRVGKTLKIIRIVRSMRLLRLVKLRRIIEEIQIRITSEYFHIIVTVLKLSLIIIWMNHFIACCWWALGMSGPREGDPDANKAWTSLHRVQGDYMGYQYFTSLHWSLTQFTPAAMEISPTNLWERVFAVVVLLTAMIVFSSFVSSITAAMTQLRQLSSTIDSNFVLLRRYLRVRNTPSDLMVRIVRCVEFRVRARESEVPESDVPLLRYLSRPLQMELLSHVYAPQFSVHPFFRSYADADPVAMQRVCAVAVQRISLSTGDALFTEACRGEDIFFLRSGRLRYYFSSSCPDRGKAEREAEFGRQSWHNSYMYDGPPAPERSKLVEEGEWFCETSLWCSWAHWGTMMAVRMSEVLAVDAKAFAKVTGMHQLVAKQAQSYARGFVERINSELENRAVSDIEQLTYEEVEELTRHAFKRAVRNPTRSSITSRMSSRSATPGDEPVEIVPKLYGSSGSSAKGCARKKEEL